MTNKTKNIILVASFILAMVLCHQLAISKTLALKKEYNTLKRETVLFENTPKQMSLLKQKQVYYDSILAKYQLNGNSLQNNLLKTINTFADSNTIKVVDFKQPHRIEVNDLKVNHYLFTLQGSYNTIIKLIHTLEQKTKFGEIVNLHFEKKKNFRTGKYYLQAHIILKSFG